MSGIESSMPISSLRRAQWKRSILEILSSPTPGGTKHYPGRSSAHLRSSIVERVLIEAWRRMKDNNPEASFEVVVVDSRPLNEGEPDYPKPTCHLSNLQAETFLSRSPDPAFYALTSSSLNSRPSSNEPPSSSSAHQPFIPTAHYTRGQGRPSSPRSPRNIGSPSWRASRRINSAKGSFWTVWQVTSLATRGPCWTSQRTRCWE